MAKLFGKTLAVMLSVLGSELLLTTSTLAQEAQADEQVRASSTPAAVEQAGLPSVGRDESKKRESKQDNTDKEKITSDNPTSKVFSTLEQYTHSVLGTRFAPEFSNQTQAHEPKTLVSKLTSDGDKQGDKQGNKDELDKEELIVQNSEPMPLPSLEEYIDPDLENSLDPETSEEEATMEQVTNVTELSDVQPTDWAFEALRSMVERYGCLEGYPDRTYRGNRAMSRYEFAAGLNRCLDRINELIATNSDFVTKEDLARLQRLQEEYATELANLEGRVDKLEARTTTLEGQQFSTTAKLGGLVTVNVADAFGEKAGPANNTTLSYEANLLLFSSFSGQDLLTVTIGAGNTRLFDSAVEFPQAPNPFLPRTDETRLLIGNSEGLPDSDLFLSQLQYQFPLNENMRVTVDAYASNRILSAPITPYNDPFTGAVSFYGKINPILYPIFLGSGVGLSWKTTPWLNLDFYYGSEIGAGNVPSLGLFNAGYAASGRAALNFGALRLALNYIHGYSSSLGVYTYSGSNPARVIGAGPVVSNTYALGGFYRLTPTIELGGSVGFINARALGEGTRGDAQVWDYRLNLALYDLGKKGNFAGIIFGIQPKLTGTSNSALAQAIGLPAGQRRDRDTGFHIEAYYSYRLNDHISITPGVFWLTAPNHDARNPDVVVGVIRTTIGF